jgi:nucleotide-binding universal stress UspA family protein
MLHPQTKGVTLWEPDMTYTAFLVPVEADPDPDHRLAFAVDLANQFEAKLVGVGAEDWRSPIAGDFDIGYMEGDLIQDKIDDVKIDLKRAEAKFGRVAATVRGGAVWRSAIHMPLSAIAALSRAADLIVTSRIVRRGASEYFSTAAPGALVLQAGRPVIVAPTDSRSLQLRNVMVAWSDSRESRRAVADALPLLKRAETVMVVEVCNRTDAAAAKDRLDDVAESLLRHGVRANTTVRVEEKGGHIPDQLLEVADQLKADLIVAGGYGQSRFQEWVFGGVTRALLSQSSRAVLLSH